METLKLLAPLAWRNIWRNPRRTIITLIVVSVGLYSILLFAAILVSWAESSRDRALTLLTGSAQIHAPGFLDDPTINRLMDAPTKKLQQALADDSIDAWAPRLSLPAVLQSEYRSMPVTLVAIDPARERLISTIPSTVSQGRYLNSADDTTIVLGEKILNRLKTRLGKRVIVMAQDIDGSLAERSFEVGGVFSGDTEVENQFAFVGISTMQSMLRTGARISEIAIHVPDEAKLAPVLNSLSAAAPDLDIRSWKELSPMAAAIDEVMGFSIYIWLWVMFMLMAFGIVNTQLMAVYERIREFGLMQALGMRPRMILAIVTLESSILVGLGALIGLVGSILTIRAMSGGIDISFFAEGAAMIGAGQVLYPKIDPAQLVQLTLVVWALGVVVALWPARKAAKSSPVEAMTHVS